MIPRSEHQFSTTIMHEQTEKTLLQWNQNSALAFHLCWFRRLCRYGTDPPLPSVSSVRHVRPHFALRVPEQASKQGEEHEDDEAERLTLREVRLSRPHHEGRHIARILVHRL